MPPLRRVTPGDVLATLAVITAVGAAAAAGPVGRALAERPSGADCVALLDRYIELVARAVDPDPARVAASIEERKAAAALAAPAALGTAESGFPRCEAELTRDEVACGLRAGNADELERCLP